MDLAPDTFDISENVYFVQCPKCGEKQGGTAKKYKCKKCRKIFTPAISKSYSNAKLKDYEFRRMERQAVAFSCQRGKYL